MKLNRQTWMFPRPPDYHDRGPRGLLTLTKGDPTSRPARDGTLRKVCWVGEQPCRLTLAFTAGQLGASLEWKQGELPLTESHIRAIFGLNDDPRIELAPDDPLTQLPPQARTLRLGRVFWFREAVLQTILHQRVSGSEAGSNWKRFCRRFGTQWEGLRLAPTAKRILSLAPAEFAACGIEQKRMIPLKEAAFRLPQLADPERSASEFQGLMRACQRIGPWTNAFVRGFYLGDPDAVPIGDYNFPNLVGYFFRGQRQSTDEQMLEDLEPYRGQRFRVLRWLKAGGVSVPRRGPRMATGQGIGTP